MRSEVGSKDYKGMLFVSLQLALFALYLWNMGQNASLTKGWVRTAGLSLTGAGILVVCLSLIKLGSHISPFPAPRSRAELCTSGVYKHIRHPIYTGIMLAAFGYAIYSGSVARLMVSGGFVVLFVFKARYEERLLKEKFPGYEAYRKRTNMFLPGIV